MHVCVDVCMHVCVVYAHPPLEFYPLHPPTLVCRFTKIIAWEGFPKQLKLTLLCDVYKINTKLRKYESGVYKSNLAYLSVRFGFAC